MKYVKHASFTFSFGFQSDKRKQSSKQWLQFETGVTAVHKIILKDDKSHKNLCVPFCCCVFLDRNLFLQGDTRKADILLKK